LHPWRRRGAPPLQIVRTKDICIWSESWKPSDKWLTQLQSRLRSAGTLSFTGGAYDDWDLEIQGGTLAGVRIRMAVEEYGGGRQMLRFRLWSRCPAAGLFVSASISCLSFAAALNRSWMAAALLGSIGAIVAGRILYEHALATNALTVALQNFTKP